MRGARFCTVIFAAAACVTQAGRHGVVSASGVPGHTSAEPQPQHWENSTDGVHSFLVFDYHEATNLSHVEAIAPRYDFIWGAGPTTPMHWRKGNPSIIVSQ